MREGTKFRQQRRSRHTNSGDDDENWKRNTDTKKINSAWQRARKGKLAFFYFAHFADDVVPKAHDFSEVKTDDKQK